VASPTSTARAADDGGLHGSSPRDPPSAPVAVAVTVAEVDLEMALPPTYAPPAHA
jgi:hypothetical protein